MLFFGIAYAVTAGYIKTNPHRRRPHPVRPSVRQQHGVSALLRHTPPSGDRRRIRKLARWGSARSLCRLLRRRRRGTCLARRGGERPIRGRRGRIDQPARDDRGQACRRQRNVAVLWLAALLGFVAGGLGASGSAYLALAIVAAAAVYAAVGVFTSQLAPSRRGALELAGLAIGIDLVCRVVADTTGTLWLHWLTPLGWIEELRPFADPRPVVLVLPLALVAVLLLAAIRIERRRDIGSAVFAAHDSREQPRLRLLSSPTALLIRFEWVSFAVWMLAIVGYGIVVGTVSKSAASGLSTSLKQQIAKLGESRILTPSGFIGLTFLFFILAISLYCCGQLAAARNEEAESRLETLFALPRGRLGWLGGRLCRDRRRDAARPRCRGRCGGRSEPRRCARFVPAAPRSRIELPALEPVVPRVRDAARCRGSPSRGWRGIWACLRRLRLGSLRLALACALLGCSGSRPSTMLD